MALAMKRIQGLQGSALLRPLRSSMSSRQIPTPRPFTQKHPLLLLTRTSSPRPQLPYLSQPSRPANLPRGPAFQRQIARLLTTENKKYVKNQVWLATKWTAVGWTMLLMLAWAYYGWMQELIEREYPSPEEWSYFTRTAYRHAHMKLDPDLDGTGVIDWGGVGSEFRRCLQRLEDVTLDGKGVTPVAETLGDDDILGVSPTSYDISEKSYQWKTGYFQVLMGCARAAEFLDDMVRDKTRKLVFPKTVVIGPSNPDPRPVPPGAAHAPKEEDCDRPYAPPETFYLKVLTGVGFTTAQRVEAALGYANWLEFKGLQDSALETYHWAVDIAASASLGDTSQVIDSTTGIIKVQPSSSSTFATALPSTNLLHTTTALATYHARTGNVHAALPIFLSVLRARHSAPIDTAAAHPAAKASRTFNPHAGTDYGAVWGLLTSIIRKVEYPPPPPSGDDVFLRHPDGEKDCTEAELMLYIGEILFATSSGTKHSEEGLGWTKKAVAIAEKGVLERDLTPEQRRVCKSCLETGVQNWGAMVKKLLKQDRESAASSILPSASSGWSSWFGGASQDKTAEVEGSRWEQEAKNVEALRARLVSESINEKMAGSKGAPGSVWVG